MDSGQHQAAYLDLAHVLATATEERESAEQQVRVGHEAKSLDRVARVAPSAAMALEAIHHGKILFGVGALGQCLLLVVHAAVLER